MLENYVIVDLETTGLSPQTDKIIEIGAIKIQKGREPEVFNRLVNPQERIPEKIVEIVGITDEMVKMEAVIEEVLPEFLEFAQDLPLLGHNLMFDYRFLKTAAVRQKRSFERSGVDTLALAKKYLAELPSKRLDVLCQYYGIEDENHHRAWNDARVTGELYRILCERFEEDTEDAKRTFSPKPLEYAIKKESPATAKQLSFLMSLCQRHGISPDASPETMTKSQASKKIDEILSAYGRW